jgi:C4-dicarboxylate-specific signal transduction histidine kinase
VNLRRLFFIRTGNTALREQLDREIKRREQAESLLAQRESTLAHAQRHGLTIGQLAASIVHEVNQPLSAVLTNAETCVRWLSRPQPDVGQALQAAQRTTREADRVVLVVKGLKTLTSECKIARTTVNVIETIEEIVLRCRPELDMHAVELKLEFDAHDIAYCNPVQFGQVVFNLVRNAIEALSAIVDRPRCLTIKTARRGDGMSCVQVIDNGTGFDAETALRIFDPMFTTKQSGMGMGLAVSRSIAEVHGGLLVGSANSRGATFCFSVPCAHDV